MRVAAISAEPQTVVAAVLEALSAGGPGDEQYQDDLTDGPGYALLDQDAGSTFAGCLCEAGIAPARVCKFLMVVRTYPIRVGGESGPLTAELSWQEIEERSGLTGLAEKELTSKTNRLRRAGEPEWDLLRKAAVFNAPTDVALTFADYLSTENTNASRFEQGPDETIRFVDEVEGVTGARVSLIATGFDARRGVINRRQW